MSSILARLSDVLWSQRLDEIDAERATRLKRAWLAYYGRFTKPLAQTSGEYDDNLRINYCRLVADMSAEFLFGKEPRWELEEGTVTEAEEWLDECWRRNNKMEFLAAIGLNGAVCGHVFIKIVPRDDGGYPALVNLSPENVRVFTDPDDIGSVWLYRIEYTDRDKDGKQLTFRQTIERDDNGRWQILDEKARGGGAFKRMHRETWPYDWPPIIDCQNLPHPNTYYGMADLEPSVIELNDGINFVMSNVLRMVRLHAHPVLWAQNVHEDDLRVTSSDVICLGGPDASLNALQAPGDLASSLAIYERLKEALHATSRVPEIAAGKMDRVGALSGLALQILYRPLI
ncbi:MAG: phage portal protein, partial [Anaerolineae bacterium]